MGIEEAREDIRDVLKNKRNSLDLSNQQLTSIPAELGKLANLQFLHLNNNRLTLIPAELTQLANLRVLYLNNNQLTSIPAELTQLANLQGLYLSNNQLTSILVELGKLVNLQELYLNNNQLTSIPPELGKLVNLQELSLHNNQLTSIPPELGKLANLQRLDLDNNQLTSIPPELGKLANLQRLDLDNNQLTSIPPELGKLANLQRLDLDNNQLTSIPPELGKLANLRVLYLHNNQLTSIPPELGKLANLQELYLNKNQLTSIPPELGKLANLQSPFLSGNPLLVSPPPEIVEQGTRAVLAYLRDQLQGGQKQWVSKMLLVGQGGVGKTSLLRALRGEPFDEGESTTRGIHIGPLPLQHPAHHDITMQLNAWDFGGQTIYHATHQFFLTNRSLFVLVWNARHGFEQGKLYYWLDTIKARAPQSPIIIVATWTDERDADIPLAELREKYPQIVGHYSVSNKTGAGVEELRRTIADAAAGLPLMGETWPANWLDAANTIRSRPENHITPNELWRIMDERQVAPDRAKVLAQWLHELGDILFFQDDEEINDTVILNPQWVTESISKVLESNEVISELGLFTRRHMNELWSDIETGMRDHFLRLMEKFDLSYRTLENRDISLVVERLSLDPPSYEKTWDEIKGSDPCNEISIRLVLDSTMPAGVPTWFIARTHRFTTRTHWRLGALFADSERKHFGLIQAYPHDRYLKLTVRGPAPHNFFVLLKDGLEVTLKRFPGINIERKVPCPGHDGKPCAHEFDLSHLENRIAKKPEIECPLSLEDVSVPHLLFGLHWGATREILIEQSNEIIERLRHISGGMSELLALTQREFTKMFRREQSQIDSYCPNIFVLRPAESSGWKRIIGEKMELQLYCQAPGNWHPVEEGGVYTITQPAEWLQTMGPYIGKMFSFLKYAAPLIGPWVGALSTDEYEKKFKTDIKLMEEMVKKLPEISSRRQEFLDDPSSATFYDSHLEHVEGASLRALRKLLEEKDPQQIWGGLKRILTPEGHYLWLCHFHAQEYKR